MSRLQFTTGAGGFRLGGIERVQAELASPSDQVNTNRCARFVFLSRAIDETAHTQPPPGLRRNFKSEATAAGTHPPRKELFLPRVCGETRS